MQQNSQTFTPNRAWRLLRRLKTQWQKQPDSKDSKMKLNENTKVGSLIFAAILLVLVALLTGCATTSVPPVSPCPVLPATPSVSTPQPSIPYSDSVQADLNEWQRLLQATPLTP